MYSQIAHQIVALFAVSSTAFAGPNVAPVAKEVGEAAANLGRSIAGGAAKTETVITTIPPGISHSKIYETETEKVVIKTGIDSKPWIERGIFTCLGIVFTQGDFTCDPRNDTKPKP